MRLLVRVFRHPRYVNITSMCLAPPHLPLTPFVHSLVYLYPVFTVYRCEFFNVCCMFPSFPNSFVSLYVLSLSFLSMLYCSLTTQSASVLVFVRFLVLFLLVVFMFRVHLYVVFFIVILFVVLFIFIICTPPSLVIVRTVFSLWLCVNVFSWCLCMTWSLGFDPSSMFSLTPLLPVSVGTVFNDLLVLTSCLFWRCILPEPH